MTANKIEFVSFEDLDRYVGEVFGFGYQHSVQYVSGKGVRIVVRNTASLDGYEALVPFAPKSGERYAVADVKAAIASIQRALNGKVEPSSVKEELQRAWTTAGAAFTSTASSEE